MSEDDILLNAIQSFAKSISKETFGLVFYRPIKEYKARNCIANVLNYIEKHGGSVIYGWYFGHRESAKFGNYLVATHHAVWRASDGVLIDITPFHEELKHQPLTIQGSIIFQVDTNSKPIQLSKLLLPRPLKFYAIGNCKLLNDYMDILRAGEAQFYIDNYGIVIQN